MPKWSQMEKNFNDKVVYLVKIYKFYRPFLYPRPIKIFKKHMCSKNFIRYKLVIPTGRDTSESIPASSYYPPVGMLVAVGKEVLDYLQQENPKSRPISQFR